MKVKNYFFFREYVLKHLQGWGLLSALAGFLFVLIHAEFETVAVERLFFLSLWGYTIIGSGIMLFRNGLLPLVGINRFQDKDARAINPFIDISGRVIENISDQDLKSLFYYLKKENVLGAKKGFFYTLFSVSIPIVLTMYLVGTSAANLFIVFVGTIIGIVFLSSFIMFFSESFFANTLRECRKIMGERKIEPDEKIYSTLLKSKFNYFIFLSVLLISIVLSFVPEINFLLLSVAVLSFVMVAVISKTLFSSIYQTFQEIKMFGERLTKDEKAEYFPGSSCEEVLDLAKNLNKSAEELHRRREEVQKVHEEIKKEKERLEKFYRLTVGRELKMAELKKKISELENGSSSGN